MTDETSQELTGFEVAIIGVAGRFPGASDVSEFWSNLRGGVESIVFMSEEELIEAGVDAAVVRAPNYVPAAALLDGYDLFDAGFFGYTPREAEIMDPQHRLFLEYAWSSLENAGYDPSRCPGPVGVFGGTGTNAYLTHNLMTSGSVDTASLSALFGNHTDYLTTRVSYKLDLKGPSFDVQTSCSTSAVAIHLASQSLLSGECDLALAGGSSVSLPHKRGYLHQEQGIYSPDGHCHAFSSKAEGTAGGSGVGVVTLRRLEDALADGDSVIAVIKGSAINNDGSGKVGYAAPSVDGQAQVIQNALSMAEVDARDVHYVETHGTGTTLGDPIEIAALTQAFRASTEDNGFCAIGSVKTNVGHLDAAAGVTGVIKAALSIQNGEIPPSLNCEEPSPACDFPNTPFHVNTSLATWNEEQRRAGVSSFGIGGTNAHIVLEQSPALRPTSASRSAQLIVISARTPKTLDAATANLADHLRAHPDVDLADVAYTLQIGRKEFDHHRVVTGRDAADVLSALDPIDRKRVRSFVQVEGERPVVFLFPGQGSQYVGMGRELYETEPTFKESVDRGCELLKSSLGFDLREVIFADSEDQAAADKLAQTSVTQPALFIIEYAMACLWMEWGLRPQAMIGHSIGEYVAATLAGVFDYEIALGLVVERGALMQALPAGAMLAVSKPAAEVEPGLPAGLSIAAINEEAACVVSGSFEAIDSYEKQLEAESVACRRLHTSHAFHSEMMEPVLAPFSDRVRAASPKAPSIPFLSNLSGTWITDADATDPNYWSKHLRNAVRFADGIKGLLEDPGRVLLEVGPGNTLTTLSSRIARRVGSENFVGVSSMRHPRESHGDLDHVLGALGQLWMARVAIDWDGFYERETRRRIPLPGYPFARDRFWVEPGKSGLLQLAPARKSDCSEWFYTPSWRRSAGLGNASAIPDEDEFLIFQSQSGPGLELAKVLRAAGKRVTTVVAGEQMAELSKGEYSVRPACREDYEALEKQLEQGNRMPEVVYHCWGCETSAQTSDEYLDHGFYSLLRIGQVFGSLDSKRSIDVVVLASDTMSVSGDEPLVPEKSSILGACLALPQECKYFRCWAIDTGRSGAELAPEILRATAAKPKDPFVAYRGDYCWIQTHEALPVPALDADHPKPLLMRENGHYLVTGGLGSVGLEVAVVLAETPGAKLVLTSRRDFHPRGEWEGWLAAHPETDETSRRIRKLLELEELGAEVWIAQASASDLGVMQKLVAEAEERFGELNGVVHAAGGEKLQTMLQATTREDCIAQFQPKLEGMEVLEQLLADKPVDFCIIQSSLAANLGLLGMVGYVGAHKLVDSFVLRHNRGDSTPWTSVNWDNWISWKEPGLLDALKEGDFYMTPDDGAEAFRRVLNLPPGLPLAISTGDLNARVEEWTRADRRDEVSDGADDQTTHSRPDLSSEFEAPRNPAEVALAAAWSNVLGFGEIGIHDSFFELGGDSVLGLQVVARTAQEGYRITPAMMFEHPTIADLAEVAESLSAVVVEESGAKGTVPLSPIQHRFFDQELPKPESFSSPVVVEVPANSDLQLLSLALSDVVRHHDALRLRYRRTSEGIEQFVEPGTSDISIRTEDLSKVAGSDRAGAMTEIAAQAHRDFDLEKGPLMQAVLCLGKSDQAAQLLWVIHHLLVDEAALRALVEDFHTARTQRLAGENVKLGANTTTFQAWATKQRELAQSESTKSEAAYWKSLAEASVAKLPSDKTAGDNNHSSSRTVAVALDEEKTGALVEDVPSVYGSRIEEVLLTALTTSVSRWIDDRGNESGNQLFVDWEGCGREDDSDVSRTVGRLTSLFPARFSLAGVQGHGEQLKSIKEQVRGIPQRGVGFGMLKYLSKDAEVSAALKALPQPELKFQYLGQLGGGSDSSGFELLLGASGSCCDPDTPRSHSLDIGASIQDGKLRIEFSYGANRHDAESVQALADGFIAELQALIVHCQDPEAGGHTPSDFPAAAVSQSDLDTLLSKLGGGGKSSRK